MMRINYNKVLTLNERKKIEKLIKKGLSCGQIAKEINRSKNGIVVEVRRGGKEKYNAISAQKEANERHKKHGIKKGITLRKKQPVFQMKQRIESLEMQMELLYDKVKELMNK